MGARVMNWYLLFKGIEAGVMLVILLVFGVFRELTVNDNPVAMPIRLLVVVLSVAIIIHAAMAFKGV